MMAICSQETLLVDLVLYLFLSSRVFGCVFMWCASSEFVFFLSNGYVNQLSVL